MEQDLKDYLDRQFTELRQDMNRRFEETTRSTNGRFEEMDGRFEAMSGEIAGLRDEAHQTRVLVETLNDKIDLLAEGVTANTEVMHRRFEEARH